MITQIDNLDQQKVSKKSKKQKNTLRQLRRAFVKLWASHRKRKAEKIALHQLMHLDDSLLKDMGLSRDELVSIQSGTLTFDSMVKQKILSNRDQACSTASVRE
ncbi:MAG: DUF1127 domain-containing protein [Gammaproteobacteria bacterium]|nr:DUF1127 domain-containing protein [Gammaproteobacteria bacterium]